MWDCGTEKILEDKRYKYVVRTQANATTEMVATVDLPAARPSPTSRPSRWSTRTTPGAATRGRSSATRSGAEARREGRRRDVPEARRVGLLDRDQPAAGARPDVILSTSWGGDLDTFVRQAGQRGLFKTSTLVLPLAESSLERLGTALPDGVIVGARGDHYFLHPETKDDPAHKAFVEKFRAEDQGLSDLSDLPHGAGARRASRPAIEAAIKANGGNWPSDRAGRRRDARTGVQGLRPARSRCARTARDWKTSCSASTKKVPAVPVPGHGQDACWCRPSS